jgi:predicted AlkP superfamily phosphohydrolase/phosphomutase
MFAHVDWSRTQAYALGLNGLYLNLQGRERHGVVRPGLEADLLLRVISRRLRDFRDGPSGTPVIADVYSPRQVFRGDALAMAPDLIVGYATPYRGSWQSALGAIPPETVENNTDAWIGDHCVAAKEVPGVLLVNRRIRLDDPWLADLTSTILGEYGVKRPTAMQGRVVW